MTELHPSVDPIANRPTSRTWTSVMAAALQSGMFENTWSIDGGSARRIVLTWADGLRLTWLGSEDHEPVDVQAWHADGSPVSLDESWEWNATIGVSAKTLTGVNEFADIVDELNATHGLPESAVLPWDSLSNDEYVDAIAYALRPDRQAPLDLDEADLDAIAETIEQIRDDLGDWDADEDADDQALVTGPLILGMVLVEAVTLPVAWGSGPVTVSVGDAYMPPASPNAKFMQFVASVEDLDDWIVIWDECCGTCASGTYKDRLAATGKPEGTPSLILFGQNTQYYFPPDGTVSYDVYLSNDDERAVIARLARQAGLTAVDGEHGSVHITN